MLNWIDKISKEVIIFFTQLPKTHILLVDHQKMIEWHHVWIFQAWWDFWNVDTLDLILLTLVFHVMV